MSTTQAIDEHVVICRLGDEQYAIEIATVEEIIRMQPITKVPEAQPGVEGMTNFRSHVMPVLDMRRCCGMAASDHTDETRIVVVVDADGRRYGLIVDGVSEVIRIPKSEIEPVAAILGSSELIRGIAKLEGRLVALLDLAAILPQPAAEDDVRELAA